LLETTIDISSELPAALLLLLGFYSLAMKRLWWSALLFTCAVYSRWNFLPIWVAVVMGVFVRYGLQQTTKFIAVGVVLFGAWYLLSLGMGFGNPLLAVYQGNYLPATDWAPIGEPLAPTEHRIVFYVEHFWFLTPPVLMALLASPVYFRKQYMADHDWAVLVALPLALASYMASMLFVGRLEPRHMAALVPTGIVFLFIWLKKICPQDKQFPAFTLSLWMICVVGLWPLSVLPELRGKLNAKPVFSESFRAELIKLPPNTHLNAPALAPLSDINGFQAMAEVKHTIVFPIASRDRSGNILEDDTVEATHRLIAATKPGELLIVPRKHSNGLDVLLSDNDWALVRNGVTSHNPPDD
jgi:hypothetical protein